MNKEIKTKKYIYTFLENGFYVKLIQTSTIRWVLDYLLFFIFFLLPGLILSVFCIVYKSYPHAVIFFVAFVGAGLGFTIRTVAEYKRDKVFSLRVDENGIFVTEVNCSLCIPWGELASFGFVDKNLIGRTVKGSKDMQTCLYFSRSVYEEEHLRKYFCRMEDKTYLHKNTDDLIVFGFQEDCPEDSLTEEIKGYIVRYSDADKEKTYLCNDSMLCF